MQEEIENKPEEIQENSAIDQSESNEEKPAAPKHPFFVFTINTVFGLVVLAGLIVITSVPVSKKRTPGATPHGTAKFKGKDTLRWFTSTSTP